MLCQNACDVPFGMTATVMPPSLLRAGAGGSDEEERLPGTTFEVADPSCIAVSPCCRMQLITPLAAASPRPSMPSSTTSPGFRYTGSGFMPKPDAGRSAGADHVARQQRHELADVADERRRRRRSCCAVVLLLHALAVDRQPHPELLRIGDLVAASRGTGRAARRCRRSCP